MTPPLARNLKVPTIAWQGQRGLSLLFTLMALALFSLAAIALGRAVESGQYVIGSLALKQDAQAASFKGAEKAMEWLGAHINDASLEGDNVGGYYYASKLDELDPTNASTAPSRRLVKWTGTWCLGTSVKCDVIPYTEPDLVNGNTVQWVITRLCDNAGSESALNPCARSTTTAVASSTERGDLTGGPRYKSGATSSPLFRIIVRASGPRNTEVFTESIVHF